MCIVIGENRGDENDGLGKDDGHYTGAVHFQGKELTGSTKLAIANDLLGVIHRNFAHTLDQQDTAEDDGDENRDLHDEDQDLSVTNRLGTQPFQKEILEEKINTSQELNLLSTNILNWIKYQSGNKRLRTESIDAQEVVQQVLSILNPLAKEKGIQLLNNILPTTTFQQFAEPFKILVYNLVLNAIRYSDQGNICVEIQDNNGCFSLLVVDTGVGMSPAKIDILLNDSSPIREKEADQKSGHGLGYLIIRDIVQWMNAQIEIESALGKGTSVCVRFQSLKNQLVNNS